MAFPSHTKFLGITIRHGWKDLGRMNSHHSIEKGEEYEEWKECDLCYRRCHVCRNHDGKLFLFCPRCLIRQK